MFPSHWDCHLALGSPTTFESVSSIRPCVPVPCGSPQNADSRTVGLKPSPLRFCSAVTLPGRRCRGFQTSLGTARKNSEPSGPGVRAKGPGGHSGSVSEACGSSSEENVPSPPPHPTAVWAWTGSDRLFSPRSPHHRCQQPRVKEAWPVWLLLSAPWWEAGPQLLTTCPRRLLPALSPSPGRFSR